MLAILPAPMNIYLLKKIRITSNINVGNVFDVIVEMNIYKI